MAIRYRLSSLLVVTAVIAAVLSSFMWQLYFVPRRVREEMLQQLESAETITLISVDLQTMFWLTLEVDDDPIIIDIGPYRQADQAVEIKSLFGETVEIEPRTDAARRLLGTLDRVDVPEAVDARDRRLEDLAKRAGRNVVTTKQEFEQFKAELRRMLLDVTD